MMDNNNELDIEALKDVTGGVIHQNIPSTHGNMCPKMPQLEIPRDQTGKDG